MTRGEIGRIIAFIRAAIPNAPAVGIETAAAWLTILGDLPYEAVDRAVRTVLIEQEIPAWPSVGRIRKAAVRIMRPAVPTAVEAWGEVTAEMRRVGWYGIPNQLSPLVRLVVRNMNWQQMCQSDKMGVVCGQFMNAYNEMVLKDLNLAALPEELHPAAMAPALPEHLLAALKDIGKDDRVVPFSDRKPE